jgi:hypothetical protein
VERNFWGMGAQKRNRRHRAERDTGGHPPIG